MTAGDATEAFQSLMASEGIECAMAQRGAQTDKMQKSSLPNLISPELIAMGKKHLKELIGMQAQLLETLQEMDRDYFGRMQLEAILASEFATKLTEACSIPETATACQEWTTKRTEMAAEDARCFLANGQKLAETGARLLSTGWLSDGHGGST